MKLFQLTNFFEVVVGVFLLKAVIILKFSLIKYVFSLFKTDTKNR